MGKLVIPAQRLALLQSFASRGQIEEAVINSMLNNIKVAELSAAAESGNAIVVTCTVSDLDGSPQASVPVHVQTVPVTSAKGYATVGVGAAITGGTQTFNFNETSGETLIVDGTLDGGSTWTAFQRTFTFNTTGSNFANIAALLGDINTAAKWDGSSLPTEFLVSNSGDSLVLTAADIYTGALGGIRVNASSTAIGTTSNTDLMFTGGDTATGSGGSPLAGQGSNNVTALTHTDGTVIVSVANDQAENTTFILRIDDGMNEILNLVFT